MSHQEILNAAERIAMYIHKTPVYTCSTIDALVGRNVFFKCENFQKSGSFKARGALNAVLRLKGRNPQLSGVVTHSTGNHGQGLAWAAKAAGLECVVVVPNDTPRVKCDAISSYGARLVFCQPSPTSRVETCQKIAEETNRPIIPPYDDYNVISGQGTIATEFLSQVPDLDTILVPISGGGMTSGIAMATKNIRPECKIFAVEPYGKELGPSLKAGQRLWTEPPKFVDTIAEGIRTQQCGQLTFPILVDYIEKDVFTVTDQEMIEAMKFVFQRMKLVIEASSAAGVAAVMSEQMKKLDPNIKKVGVILCGGNVDINSLPW